MPSSGEIKAQLDLCVEWQRVYQTGGYAPPFDAPRREMAHGAWISPKGLFSMGDPAGEFADGLKAQQDRIDATLVDAGNRLWAAYQSALEYEAWLESTQYITVC